MKNKIFFITLLLLSSLNISYGQNDLNARFPFAFVVQGCDELVFVQGVYHVISDFDVTPGGTAHGNFHINAKGTGVGLSSGAKYQWNDAINDAFHAAAGLTETYQRQLHLIGQGKTPNLIANFDFHITINANGELTVLFDELEITCH